jgi:hypothetical protein
MFLDNLEVNNEDTSNENGGLVSQSYQCIVAYSILEPMLNIFDVLLAVKYDALLKYVFYGIILAGIGLATGDIWASVIALLPVALSVLADSFNPITTTTESKSRLQGTRGSGDYRASSIKFQEKRLERAVSAGVDIPKLGPNLWLNELRTRFNPKSPFALMYNLSRSKSVHIVSWLIIALTTLLSIVCFNGYSISGVLFGAATLAVLFGIQYKLKYGKKVKILREIATQRTDQLNELTIKYGEISKRAEDRGILHLMVEDDNSYLKPVEAEMNDRLAAMQG